MRNRKLATLFVLASSGILLQGCNGFNAWLIGSQIGVNLTGIAANLVTLTR